MKGVILQPRQKELLLKAFEMFQKRAESVKQGIEELGYSSMVVDGPISQVEWSRSHLLKSRGGFLGFLTSEPHKEEVFRASAMSALAYNLLKLEKVEKAQTDVLVPTDDTRETMTQVERLRAIFADQYSFDLEMTFEEAEERAVRLHATSASPLEHAAAPA